MQNIKIDILPNQFLNENGTFNNKEALKFCGVIAGVCYDEEGYDHIKNESEEKTMNRVNKTLKNEHHSVFDHVLINLNIHNIPKILAMVLNNEKQYTTSEKSARYTNKIEQNNYITKKEIELYNKWTSILNKTIEKKYGNCLKQTKIKKLCNENARYFITTFMPTEMVYSTTLRQINYLVSFMEEYIINHNSQDIFEEKLSFAMEEFINQLIEKNLLVDGLMQNRKNRHLSLFGNNLSDKEIHFGYTYSTIYKGSLAQLAQAERHRSLDYEMEFLIKKEYFIPPIIKDDKAMVEEWLSDMNLVKDSTPQGELVKIYESGKYEKFILKCKERLCTEAQLEIMVQTKNTLESYKKYLENSKSPLYEDIKKYGNGARCTFYDYECNNDCKFNEGKVLKRKI